MPVHLGTYFPGCAAATPDARLRAGMLGGRTETDAEWPRMIDYKTVAQSVADGLNGIVRAMQSIPAANATPEFERWKREMSEASKHVLMAFGIDPEQLQKPAIPCGGGWYVEWKDGEPGEWRVVGR